MKSLLLLLLALLCVLPIVFCNENIVTDVAEAASAESSLNSTETIIEANSTDSNATGNVDDNLDVLQLLLDKMEAGIDTSDELSALEDLDEDQREAMFKKHDERMAVLKANLLAEEGVRLDQSPVESSPLEQAANGEDDADDGDDEEVDAETIQHLVASLAAVQSKLAAASANESSAQPDVGVDVDSSSDADEGEEEDISSENIDELLNSLRDMGMFF
jgi:primase-polymerase (primpol)-like protein